MSISYELAKKLKDRGFPQPEYPMGRGGWEEEKGADIIPGITPHSIRQKMLIYVPTLSELISEVIEKCASFMLSTSLLREGWRAEGQLREAIGGKQFDEFGLTPEEAVASLWLKLHEKK